MHIIYTYIVVYIYVKRKQIKQNRKINIIYTCAIIKGLFGSWLTVSHFA